MTTSLRDLPPGLDVPEGLVTPLFPEPIEPGLWDMLTPVADAVENAVVTALFVVTAPVWLPGMLLTWWLIEQSEDA